MDRIHFLYLDALFKGANYPEQLQNTNLFMPDHLHPSEDGYHAIVNLLKLFMVQFDAVIDAEVELMQPKELNITKTIIDTVL